MAALTLAAFNAGAAVNLTALGADDWAYWQSTATSGVPSQRKSGGGSTVGTLSVFGSGTFTGYTNDLRTVSWTDGTPTGSLSTLDGLYNNVNSGGTTLTGSGFSFTLPADTTPRQALVYLAGYAATSVSITGTLSDGSSPSVTNSAGFFMGSAAQGDGYALFTYAAGSAGQTLTVKVVLAGTGAFGNVAIQAAAVKAGAFFMTPGTGTVSITGLAPTVTRTANQGATPGAGSLALAGFAPTVARTANQALTAGAGAVSLTGFAPTVAQTANQALTAGAGVLSLTGYAPTVGQSSGATITPGAGAVAFTGYAPAVSQTFNQSLTAGAGSVVIAGYAPTVSQPQAAFPGAGSIAFTGYAPSVAQTANQSVLPGVGAVALSGFAPTIAQSANQAVLPGVGNVTLTGFAPTITVASASPSLVPDAGVLTITGYAPTVSQQAAGGGIDTWGSVYVRTKKKKKEPEAIPVAGPVVREFIEAAMQAHEPPGSKSATRAPAVINDDDEEEELWMLLL